MRRDAKKRAQHLFFHLGAGLAILFLVGMIGLAIRVSLTGDASKYWPSGIDDG
jgi:hypothetical protein